MNHDLDNLVVWYPSQSQLRFNVINRGGDMNSTYLYIWVGFFTDYNWTFVLMRMIYR